MSTAPTVSNRRLHPSALLARGVAGALRAYHRYYSPLRPPACRFTPSCSEYAATAFERFGLLRGSWLTVRRLSRCHPYHRGGHDPVPDKVDSNRAAEHRTDDVPDASDDPTTPTASIAARGATTSIPAGAPRCHTC